MDKYAYGATWTKHEGFIKVRTYRAFCACRLLDFSDDVTCFSRNRETLTYILDGNRRQLTPDFKVHYKDSEFYLHTYRQQLTQPQILCLSQQHSIKFWKHDWIVNHPQVKNVDLLRRYHRGLMFPDFGQTLTIPDLLYVPLTAQNLCEELGYEIGEANKLLLQLSAYKKLRFDVNQPYTNNTEFHKIPYKEQS